MGKSTAVSPRNAKSGYYFPLDQYSTLVKQYQKLVFSYERMSKGARQDNAALRAENRALTETISELRKALRRAKGVL